VIPQRYDHTNDRSCSDGTTFVPTQPERDMRRARVASLRGAATMRSPMMLARGAFCLPVVVATLCAGCGGSSSETPPPQQPDSWQMVMRKPAVAPASSGEAKRSPWVYGRYNKAESTWGTKSRAPSQPPVRAFADAGTPDDL
jgi:hypothetical protein